MYYADKIGLPLVRGTLVEMGLQPSALLEACVAQGATLAKYWENEAKNNSKMQSIVQFSKQLSSFIVQVMHQCAVQSEHL